MPLTVINGPVIAAGESLSNSIDVSGGPLVRLTMPTDWEAADITFQISSDDGFYNDLYDHHGGEVTCVCTPGAGIIFPRDMLAGVAFIRFRSGTSQSPRPQSEQRQFAVAVLTETVDAPAATRAKSQSKTEPARQSRKGRKIGARSRAW